MFRSGDKPDVPVDHLQADIARRERQGLLPHRVLGNAVDDNRVADLRGNIQLHPRHRPRNI